MTHHGLFGRSESPAWPDYPFGDRPTTKRRRGQPCLVALAITLAGPASCAPALPQDLRTSGARITSEADYGAGRRLGRSSFGGQEGLVIVADVTWAEPVYDAGVHEVDWQLFQGDRLVKERREDARLIGKPSHIMSHISAGSFASGDYRAALLMDGKPVASVPFRIAAGVEPPALPAPAADPEYRTDVKGQIKPIRAGRAAFPPAAIERRDKGCAVAAIKLGGDGHPTDVRIIVEYPQGFGFGDAVRQAAWDSLFPPGHAGETTLISVHFETAH